MPPMTGNVTELSPQMMVGSRSTTACPCWVCQTSLSGRAAFCHECGAIQPVRSQDPFTRLGLERRFDLDQATLESRYLALSRIFRAERHMAKGPRQKQLAQEQSAAVDEAYAGLRCPARRAATLLGLLGQEVNPEGVADGATQDLLTELNRASDAAEVNRVVFKAVHGVEVAIRDLSAAFRRQSYEQAAVILARLTQFEDIAAQARARRSVA